MNEHNETTKNRVNVVEIQHYGSFVTSQSTRVTDRQTDGQTDGLITGIPL